MAYPSPELGLSQTCPQVDFSCLEVDSGHDGRLLQCVR